MKKIRLTEGDIMSMVRSVLNEISANDAYQRFYKDKIPEQVWNTLMDGVVNMTPFHKAILDLFVKQNASAADNAGMLRLAFVNEMEVAESASAVWNKSIKGQQFLTNISKNEGYYVFSSIGKLKEFLRKFNDKQYFSEAEYIDNGLVKLYEDDYWLVTCTTSYSASKKYYGDSHWCTASDVFGEHNGFKMFKYYVTGNYGENSGNILVQFVNKQNRNYSLQAAFSLSRRYESICDFEDSQASYRDFADVIDADTEGGDSRIGRINKILSEKVGELHRQSIKFIEEEEEYWNLKVYSYAKKAVGKISGLINSKETDEHVFEMLNEADYDDSFYLTRMGENEENYLLMIEIRIDSEEPESFFFGEKALQLFNIVFDNGFGNPKLYRKYWLMSKSDNKLIREFSGDYYVTNATNNVLFLRKTDNSIGGLPCLSCVIDMRSGETLLNLEKGYRWKVVTKSYKNIAYIWYESDGYLNKIKYEIDTETGEVREVDKTL